MANVDDQSPEHHGDRSVLEEFGSPPQEYGPVPLWWWDGEELNEDRMTEQLEALEKAGVPSVCFIQKYPNGPTGDEQQYFGEEWWDRMEHAARECERLGMDLWVHDETYHHSPPTWREFWQDRIRAEVTEREELLGHVLDRVAEDVTGPGEVALSVPEDFECLSAAAYPRNEDGTLLLEDEVPLDLEDGEFRWEAEDGDWHVAAVGVRPEGLRYTTPLAAQRYIDLHFEEYRRRLGDLLGDVVVGTFEDELVILDDEVPCDDTVLKRFKNEYDYDPVPELIGLYEETTADSERLRTHYYDVVTELVEENWFEPLYAWHDEHGLHRSHDNWGRNDMAAGTVQYGDYYRTMRWYQVPGYDDGGATAIGSRNFFDAKLAASIAACYDRERVWGELFHSTGWGFEPEAQLAGIVENVCYGANLYDKHGLYYTTQGGWWAHAPPDTHFRQPYWKDVDDLHDVVTRLSYLFSQGTPVVDVAMVYPGTSLHADWSPEDGVGETGQRVDEQVREIAERLYKTGTDLVFADPDSIADADVDGGTLSIQDMEIPVLLLGPTTALREDALSSIRAFHDAGGVVIGVGELPTTVVGRDRDTSRDRLDDTLDRVFGEAYQSAQRGALEGHRIHDEGEGTGVLADFDADLSGLVDSVIDSDVRRSAGDVYHAHRRIGDLDAYLLFNARDESRRVKVELRAVGEPQRWDPFTGDAKPIETYDRRDGYAEFELEFAPHDFQLLVLEGDADDNPRVVDTSLSSVEAVEETDTGVAVTGRIRSGGAHSADVVQDGTRRRGRIEDADDHETIELDNEWTIDLEPTMDNRWGDFRYPPSDEIIGPEIDRIVHRAEEPNEDGLQQGWYRGSVQTADWTTVARTYGPYFWLRTGVEGDLGMTPNEDAAGWVPYEFSKRFGKPDTHPYLLGYTSTVSDNYLVSPEGEGTNYFWTTLRSPETQTVACHYGPGIREIELGEQIIVPDYAEDLGSLGKSEDTGAGETAIVQLPAGRTEVRIEVNPGAETYFAIDSPDGAALDRDLRYVPRVRWFVDELAEFDYRPWADRPVGWYRFEAPAGTRSFDLPVRGEPQVWVDGRERSVEDGCVTLSDPDGDPSTVAIRIEQEPGAYGGAAFERSPQVETEPVSVDLRDWEGFGLPSYSGRARYRTTVTVPDLDPDDCAVLDLGEVAVSASVRVNGTPVGSTFRRPFALDVTDALEAGENDVEVVVANTLANHFHAETPRRYVEEAIEWFGDETNLLPSAASDDFPSGLSGPVTLRIEPAVTIETE